MSNNFPELNPPAVFDVLKLRRPSESSDQRRGSETNQSVFEVIKLRQQQQQQRRPSIAQTLLGRRPSVANAQNHFAAEEILVAQLADESVESLREKQRVAEEHLEKMREAIREKEEKENEKVATMIKAKMSQMEEELEEHRQRRIQARNELARLQKEKELYKKGLEERSFGEMRMKKEAIVEKMALLTIELEQQREQRNRVMSEITARSTLLAELEKAREYLKIIFTMKVNQTHWLMHRTYLHL